MGLTAMIWLCVGIYMAVMVFLGYVGTKRTTSADAYATARGGYPWWSVGMVLAATFASGATFMGSAGMGYAMGFPVLWYYLLYAFGGYLGMVFFGKFARNMNRIGARTMPELLGERYQSGTLRILMAVVSILLLFYIGGQVTASGTLIATLMGVPYQWAIWLSVGLILVYLTTGGAHADFLTDTVQAFVMAAVAIVCVAIFFLTPGIPGGLAEVNTKLVSIDPNIGYNSLFYPNHPQYASWFPVIMIFFAHLPFALQPHFGIKFLGIRRVEDLPKAIFLAAVVGTLFSVGAGIPGIVGRAILPETLPRPDMVLPALFNHVFPPVVTAILVAGILCAVMSTVDGLLLGVSQLFANDLYRRTIAELLKHSPERIERNCNIISRVAVVVAAVAGTLLVVSPPPFLTLFIWFAVGGILGGATGPLILGAVWKDVTKPAAIGGFIAGDIVYFIEALALNGSGMIGCGVAVIIGTLATFILTLLTREKYRFSDEHLAKFGFKVSPMPQLGGGEERQVRYNHGGQ